MARFKNEYKQAGVWAEKSEVMDDLGIKKLDKVTVRQRLYIQLEGPSNSTDYTIMPFEFDISFYIAFKKGLHSSLGPQPDIAFKLAHAKAELLDCEYVENPFRSLAASAPGGTSSDSNEDDDDDFDEDDEDEAGGASSGDKESNDKSKLKLFPISQLACSMKSRVNDLLQTHFEAKFIHVLQDYPNDSNANSWYVLKETEISNILLCQGVQLRDMQIFFEDKRFGFRFNISDKAMRMDAWCDHYDRELYDYDPRQLANADRAEGLARFEEELRINEEYILFHHLKFWIRGRLFGNGNHHDREFLPVVVHMLASYYPYREWCLEHHPEKNPTICATTYLQMKQDINNLDFLPNVFTDYADDELGHKIRSWYEYTLEKAFYLALFLYIFKIDLFKRDNLPLIVFLLNSLI